MTGSGDTRRQQAEERRQQILEVALRLFCERGYEGTTVRDIAREVGVTEGLLYHYFASKDKLIHEVWHRQSWPGKIDSLLKRLADAPLRLALAEIVADHLETLYSQGPAVRMHATEMLRNGDLAHRSRLYIEQARALLTEFLRRRQARGDISHDADVEMVAGFLLGSGFSVFMVYGRSDQAEWRRVADRVVGCLSSILASGLNTCPQTEG